LFLAVGQGEVGGVQATGGFFESHACLHFSPIKPHHV
jgi:hypothetical protein